MYNNHFQIKNETPLVIVVFSIRLVVRLRDLASSQRQLRTLQLIQRPSRSHWHCRSAATGPRPAEHGEQLQLVPFGRGPKARGFADLVDGVQYTVRW